MSESSLEVIDTNFSEFSEKQETNHHENDDNDQYNVSEDEHENLYDEQNSGLKLYIDIRKRLKNMYSEDNLKDDHSILFSLGIFSGGILGSNIACFSWGAAICKISMINNISASTREYCSLVLMSWICICIYMQIFDISAISACELGRLFITNAHGTIDSVDAGVLSIALSSFWVHSYFNAFLILTYRIYTAYTYII